jgi:hypothetical protein
MHLALPYSFLDLNRHLLLYYDFEQMTESNVSDKSGNGRFATMYNEDIIDQDGRCQLKGIALNSLPLHINNPLAPNRKHKVVSNLQLTVAVWIFLKMVTYIV